VPYVLGTFNILDSFELTGDDFFPSGVVAIAQSKENPNLLIEQVFCADKRMVPTLHRTLLTGLDIDLKRENELAAIINIERLADGRIKLTTVSILYPSYESATADGTFTLDPPDRLNVRAVLPVVDSTRQREADSKYDHFRRKARLAGKEETKPGASADTASRLMRVERPLVVVHRLRGVDAHRVAEHVLHRSLRKSPGILRTFGRRGKPRPEHGGDRPPRPGLNRASSPAAAAPKAA
jgi:hypothetical protein